MAWLLQDSLRMGIDLNISQVQCWVHWELLYLVCYCFRDHDTPMTALGTFEQCRAKFIPFSLVICSTFKEGVDSNMLPLHLQSPEGPLLVDVQCRLQRAPMCLDRDWPTLWTVTPKADIVH